MHNVTKSLLAVTPLPTVYQEKKSESIWVQDRVIVTNKNTVEFEKR
jgi:hypothetical protein